MFWKVKDGLQYSDLTPKCKFCQIFQFTRGDRKLSDFSLKWSVIKIVNDVLVTNVS